MLKTISKKPKSIKVSLFLAFCFAASVGLESSRVAQAAPAPSTIGQCTDTFISTLGTRLIDGATGEPMPNSGTSVHLNNGIILVALNTVAAAESSKAGDKVKLCLESIPQSCFTNQNPGKLYKVTNYRTGKEFTLSNSEPFCGGT